MGDGRQGYRLNGPIKESETQNRSASHTGSDSDAVVLPYIVPAIDPFHFQREVFGWNAGKSVEEHRRNDGAVRRIDR
jgi:hypothetical protein